MNWKAIFDAIRSNPIVVGVWTAFAGALGSAIETAMDNHSVWTLQSVEHMLCAAAGVAALSLIHLYMNPPNRVPPPPGQQVAQNTDAFGKVIPMLLLFVVALGLAGCPANQSQLQKAATASQQAMIVVQGFQQGEIVAYSEGKACAATGASGCVIIQDSDHLFIQQSIQTIAELDKSTNTCIGSAGTAAGAVTCANSAIVTITQLQADCDLRIKSAQAKQDFDLAMIGARTALNIISTILGGN